MTWVGQIQGNLEPPEEKGMENKLFFLSPSTCAQKECSETYQNCGRETPFVCPREGKTPESREEEFQLMLCVQLAVLLGL